MMKLLVINGVNIGMIGKREPEVYGTKSYKELCSEIKAYARKNSVTVRIFQSDSEYKTIKKIHNAYTHFDGIIINAGAYTHTSVAIMDALKAVNIDVVEVHLSDITKREDFRKTSYISLVARKIIYGCGFEGYFRAIDYFLSKTHRMRLQNEPFNQIKNGKKSIEIRLFDEKRRLINVGDKIIFTNRETHKSLTVTVESLIRTKTFKELFEKVGLQKCGFTCTLNEAIQSMRNYYSEEEENADGVLGIGIKKD